MITKLRNMVGKMTKVKILIIASITVIFYAIWKLFSMIIDLYTWVKSMTASNVSSEDAILLPIFALLIARWAYVRNDPTTSYIPSWMKNVWLAFKKQWDKEWLPALVGLMFIHLTVRRIWPTWYNDALVKPNFWFFQIVCFVGFLMRPKSPTPAKHRIGILVIGLTVIGLLDLFGWLPVSEASWKKGNAIQRSADPLMGWFHKNSYHDKPSPLSDDHKLLPKNAENERKVRTFFSKTKLSPEMKSFMVCVAEHESGFNQKNPDDGTVYTHKNEDGTVDHGVMQINDVWLNGLKQDWPQLDVEEFYGNLNASIYVLAKQGPSAWKNVSGKCSIDGLSEETSAEDLPADTKQYIAKYHLSKFEVIAKPGEEFGEEIPTPGYALIDAQGPIEMIGADGRKFKTEKGNKSPIPYTKSKRFRSTSDKEVTIYLYK